jgi:O-antigen/teichoic acid export membrane protein
MKAHSTSTDTDQFAAEAAAHPEFKRKTTRGGLAALTGQGTTFLLRMISLVTLARLLSPRDFGLVGMVTAVTGVLTYFQDAGLSAAAIQSPTISRAQTSTLFWINVAIGAVLTLVCIGLAPFLAAFYREPRLELVTEIIAGSFLCFGASAQHRALLVREMCLMTLAISDLCGSALSVALGIGCALLGAGYWALVVMAVTPSVANLVAVWSLGRWIPGLPRWGSGIGGMLRYGGLLMADNVVMYFSYYTDKILIGRVCGAVVLGVYGRAYTLINVPSQNLASAFGATLFPALARLQHQPERFRNYFLKSYTLFLSLAFPVTVACGLFGEDIIRVFLGPKWSDAVPVFRLLAPTILAFALINPTGILLQALGRMAQSLYIGLLILPVNLIAYAVGIRWGAVGVASGFSIAMVVLIVPTILWGIAGTPIRPRDLFRAIAPPLLSVFIAAACALACWVLVSRVPVPLVRLVLVNGVLFTVHAALLYFAFGQRALYLSVLEGLGVTKRFSGLFAKAVRVVSAPLCLRSSVRWPVEPGVPPVPLEGRHSSKLGRRQQGSFNTRTNLCESGFSGSGKIISKGRKTTVVGRSE